MRVESEKFTTEPAAPNCAQVGRRWGSVRPPWLLADGAQAYQKKFAALQRAYRNDAA
jgi:hypothetical protein